MLGREKRMAKKMRIKDIEKYRRNSRQFYNAAKLLKYPQHTIHRR